MTKRIIASSTDSGLVFSSEHGEMCPACRRPVARCACTRTSAAAKPGGAVIVGRETSGRKGKGVTVIRGVPLTAPELAQLATELKQRCASGGTVRDGVIEIQGDHRDRIVQALQERGWTVKRSGG